MFAAGCDRGAISFLDLFGLIYPLLNMFGKLVNPVSCKRVISDISDSVLLLIKAGGFTSRLTARVLLGRVLNQSLVGVQPTEVTACD